MYQALLTHLNLLETLMGMKVEQMIIISKRDGLGDELEKIIELDHKIYQLIARMRALINYYMEEP